MPSQIASLLCIAFIVWLLVRDVRANPTVSHAMWIPWLWFALKASKSLTQWIYGVTNISNLTGAPASVDRYLIIIGLLVLTRRSLSWSKFIKSNWAISFYLFYTLGSIAWSETPLTIVTQWPHMLLQFLMVLIVYTEKEPAKAFYALFRRCAYFLLPLSVLYIKYYPALGRSYDMWTGAAAYSGAMDDKNTLGSTCWVMGVMFLSLLFAGPKGNRLVSGFDRYLAMFFLAMIGWLINAAKSSTALVAFAIGSAVILGLQNSAIRRHLTAFLLFGCLGGAALLTFTNIEETFILSLGEDLTLTGRTELWEDLKKTTVNPVVGPGFESFWSGERKDALWRKYWWHPNQAHNGYFEVYLNLGVLGLLTLCAIVFSCYAKARGRLLAISPDGKRTRCEEDGIVQFRLAFLLAFLAVNWTDAAFRSVTFLFLVFAVVAIEYVPLPEKLAGRFTAYPARSKRVLQPSS
jgi:exopolysaccharide production protein ExoQ